MQAPPQTATSLYSARWSRLAFWFVALAVGVASFFYPKWKQSGSNATLSWDVFGYYLYLPAVFIYQDLDSLGFVEEVFPTYHPADDFHHATPGPAGKYVLKYPAGMALVYLPAFSLAHGVAKLAGYPADGFSLPYQAAVLAWSAFLALLGMWGLRRWLLGYFSDTVVAAVVLTVGLGSNWLMYASTNSAMTHGVLFSGYVGMWLLTERWQKNPKVATALLMGLLAGWMALIRPLDGLVVFLALFWPGPGGQMTVRMRLLGQRWPQVLVAAGAMLLVGMIQLGYWKWATGSFLFYSYGDESFNFAKSNLINGLISYRKGWLVYSPAMVLAVAGLFFLGKKGRWLMVVTLAYVLGYIFIVFSWENWWYGGGFGARALIQIYPLCALGMGALLSLGEKKRWLGMAFGVIALLGSGVNVFFTWKAQAPGSGWEPEYTTKLYFLHTAFKTRYDPADRKYLDLSHDFGSPSAEDLQSVPFLSPTDTLVFLGEGEKALGVLEMDKLPAQTLRGLRFKVKFYHESPDWGPWDQPRLVVSQLRGDKAVRTLRLRIPWNGPLREWHDLEFDMQPRKGFKPGDRITVSVDQLHTTRQVVLTGWEVFGVKK